MNWLLGTDGFPPRWRCGTAWEAEPWVGWLHVVGDSLIAAAYVSIPVLLIVLVRKRGDLPFHWVGGLFAAFILACGATHAIDAVIFWEPLYRLSGLMKGATAAVSWATVICLLWVLPGLLHLPGRAKLADELAVEAEERRRAEAAEREARRAADAANAAKTRFLAAMSHELRTPLTAVLGFADLLAKETADPDRREMARQIRSNGSHLLTLLNDVLDLSKVEAGKLEVARESVALVPLVEEVRSLMNVRAAERDLRLEVDYLGPVPRTVETDPVRLRQCLLNLVSNGIKFTDRGRVRLDVRFLPGDPAGDGERAGTHGPRVRFDVTDTGVGMTEAQLAGLFRPFGQVDEQAERRAGGTGLGLAITKRLAEMLGGEVRVESEPGAGSTFTLIVAAGPGAGEDLADPDAHRPPAEPPPAEPAPAPLAPGRAAGVRALLAEDTRALQTLFTRVLESAGAEVTGVGDGKAAVDAWTADPAGFDVILLDMQMPHLNGYESAAALRAAGCRLPIVALTAGAMAGDRARCLEAGCDAYLAKPIDPVELAKTVARLAAEPVGSSDDG